MLKPLQSPPWIDVNTEDDELQLNDLDFDPNTVMTIQERAKAKLKNKEHAHRAMVCIQGLLMKVYNSLLSLADLTSDRGCVYMKLFSVNDANQHRLVRFMVSNIFKPNVRGA